MARALLSKLAGATSGLSFLLLINLAPRWRCRNAITTAQISSCWWTKDTAARMAKTIFACAKPCPKRRLWPLPVRLCCKTIKLKTSSARLFIPTPCNKRWKTKRLRRCCTKNAKQNSAPMTKPSTLGLIALPIR